MAKANEQTPATNTTKSKAAPKKSVQVDTILGMGAINFNKGLTAILEGAEKVKGLAEFSERMSAEISEKQDRLNDLDLQLTEKKRQNALDLELTTRANEKNFVEEWAKNNGFTVIFTTELESTRTELNTLKTDFTNKISAEVKKAEAIAENRFTGELKLKESEFARKEADNNAKITSLSSQNEFLNQQVNYWKEQLEAERKAGIERAKAGAITNLNLAGGNSK